MAGQRSGREAEGSCMQHPRPGLAPRGCWQHSRAGGRQRGSCQAASAGASPLPMQAEHVCALQVKAYAELCLYWYQNSKIVCGFCYWAAAAGRGR